MNKVPLDKVAVAANYLRPMLTPTRILVLVDDITKAADDLRCALGETIHVGLGGCVSHGRLVDPVLADFADATKEQTIIVECYGNTRAVEDFFFCSDDGEIGDLARAVGLFKIKEVEDFNPNTVIIFVDKAVPDNYRSDKVCSRGISDQRLLNRMVSFDTTD